jgi:hypothetical protein
MTQLTPKTENIADAKESGHDARLPTGQAGTRVTGFEPEILAFCCEH